MTIHDTFPTSAEFLPAFREFIQSLGGFELEGKLVLDGESNEAVIPWLRLDGATDDEIEGFCKCITEVTVQ